METLDILSIITDMINYKSIINWDLQSNQIQDDEFCLSFTESNNIRTCHLPYILQTIIEQEIEKCPENNDYLRHITHYPSLCRYLTNQSVNSYNYRPYRTQVHLLIVNHVPNGIVDYSTLIFHIQDQLRDLHRKYLLEVHGDVCQEDTIAKRIKQYQRMTLSR
jgi:hypothetical protein